MQVYRFAENKQWPALLQRPVADRAGLEDKVRRVLDAVRSGGDPELRRFTLEFDKVSLSQISVSDDEINMAMNAVDPALLEAMRTAADNITQFHRAQRLPEERITTMPGVECWRKSVGIEKVGLYIPGGTAPLFSTVLMLTIPAVLAGCREIVICTPPNADGRIHPAILAAAAYIGVRSIYKVGGVQAIAAMAYGTETVPKVYKIFGPGNQYVTMAKQLVQQEGVSIDMPAGPSEVAIYADRSASPKYIAADLLSQAEHGADSQVVLVTDHEPLVAEVETELVIQTSALPRKSFAEASLRHSRIFLVEDRAEAMQLLNAYAPEHLILACERPGELADQVVNAGSVFLGHFSPESAGDYASGTNHTLPTNGYAQAYSGVSVDSFLKKITFQQLSRDGLAAIGPAVMTMAEAEGLRAHAEAVRIRLTDKNDMP